MPSLLHRFHTCGRRIDDLAGLVGVRRAIEVLSALTPRASDPLQSNLNCSSSAHVLLPAESGITTGEHGQPRFKRGDEDFVRLLPGLFKRWRENAALHEQIVTCGVFAGFVLRGLVGAVGRIEMLKSGLRAAASANTGCPRPGKETTQKRSPKQNGPEQEEP